MLWYCRDNDVKRMFIIVMCGRRGGGGGGGGGGDGDVSKNVMDTKWK